MRMRKEGFFNEGVEKNNASGRQNNRENNYSTIDGSQNSVISYAEGLVHSQSDVPRLKKQNFHISKILQISQVTVPAFLFIFTFAFFFLDVSQRIFNTYLTTAMFVMLAISELSLFSLKKYISNFDVHSEVYKSINSAMILLPVIVLSIGAILLVDLPVVGVVFFIALSIAGIALKYNTLSQIGIYLRDAATSDYIGGLDTLGNLLKSGNSIPLFLLAVPAYLYRIYSNAQDYTEIHGFDEE